MNKLLCPPPDTLESLLAARLSAEQESQVTGHIENCDACQSRLETLTDDRTLKSFSHLKSPASTIEAAPGWLLAKLAVPTQKPSEPDEVLSFLNMPIHEGDLGQLGTYRVKQVLGRGGMGVVLLAYDTSLKRLVALKVLWPPPGDAAAKNRIFREAQAAAQIRHEHVVGIHAVHNHPYEPPYLVMEYVPGKTLRDHIKQPNLPLPQIVWWCIEIAEGLGAAHAVGLIHRDIKPTNILIDEVTRKAKLTDFGLACVSNPQADQHSIALLAGTPAYMSPEQIHHPQQVDVRSDIYGLGATLYEAITGTPPFRGPVEGVIRQIVDVDPVPPRRLNLAVPVDLETICMKCLAKDPAQRYATADDLAADLRRYVEGKPIHARPLSLAGHFIKAVRRHPKLAGMAALLLITLFAGTAVSLFYWQRAEQNLALANEKVEAAFRTIDQFCLRVSEDRLLNEAGMQPLRKELLTIAIPELQKLSLDKPSDPKLHAKWIKSTYLLAKLRRDIEGPAHAIPILQGILPYLKEKYHQQPSDPENRRLLIDVLIYEGICRSNLLQYPQAKAIWNEVEELLKGHDEPDDRLLHSRLYINMNKTAADQRDYPTAMKYAERAQVIARKLTASNPEILTGHYCLGTSTGNLAHGLGVLGKYADSEKTFHEAIAIWKRISNDNPKELSAHIELLRNQANLAEMFLLTRRFADANKELQAGLPQVERLLRTYPQSLTLRKFHGQFHLYAGLCNHMTGKTTAAEKHYQQAVDITTTYHTDDPDDVPIHYDLLRARLLQAYHWQDSYNLTDAAQSFGQIYSMLEEYADKVPDAAQEMKGHGHTVLYSRAMVLTELGKPAEARSDLETVKNDKPHFTAFSHMVITVHDEITTGKDLSKDMLNHYRQFMDECKAAEAAAPPTAAMYRLAATCAGRSLNLIKLDDKLKPEERDKLTKDFRTTTLRWLNMAKSYGYFTSPERKASLQRDAALTLLHNTEEWKTLILPSPPAGEWPGVRGRNR